MMQRHGDNGPEPEGRCQVPLLTWAKRWCTLRCVSWLVLSGVTYCRYQVQHSCQHIERCFYAQVGALMQCEAVVSERVSEGGSVKPYYSLYSCMFSLCFFLLDFDMVWQWWVNESGREEVWSLMTHYILVQVSLLFYWIGFWCGESVVSEWLNDWASECWTV